MALRLLILWIAVSASLAAAEEASPGSSPKSPADVTGLAWEFPGDETILPGPEGGGQEPRIPSGEDGGTNAAVGDTLHDFYPLYCLVSIAVGILILIAH